jgi:hypothetical protein
VSTTSQNAGKHRYEHEHAALHGLTKLIQNGVPSGSTGVCASIFTRDALQATAIGIAHLPRAHERRIRDLRMHGSYLRTPHRARAASPRALAATPGRLWPQWQQPWPRPQLGLRRRPGRAGTEACFALAGTEGSVLRG